MQLGREDAGTSLGSIAAGPAYATCSTSRSSNAVCELCRRAIGYEQLLLCCSDCKGAQKNSNCLLEKWCRGCLLEFLNEEPEEWFCDECNQRRNEGSYSRSLGKGSPEVQSKHAQFDILSQQPITSGINFAAPAPPQSPATGITQSKVITHDQLAPEHDPPMRSDGEGQRISQEQGRQLREGPDRVWQCTDGHRGTRTSVGSSETNKELTFEQVSRYFSMPIKQAAREMNMGLTVLKKHCRKLGITRWPQRKLKSLQKLIDDVQGLGKENGHLTSSLVGSMQQTMKLFGDDEAEELRQVCFNENNAKEDVHLTRRVVEFLQLKMKKIIEERPDMILDQRTKQLRQAFFKESHNRNRRPRHMVKDASACRFGP